MVDINLNYSTSAVCSSGIVPAVVIITKKVPGSDNGLQNWEIIDDHHIRLRASLVGLTTNGRTNYAARTYIISLTVVASSGLSSNGSVAVSVPLLKKPIMRPHR